MNLSLTDEQILMQESFSRLFSRESSIDRVRAALPTGFDSNLWAALVETGAPIARVPEEKGGLGLSMLDAALIAEEAGRHLVSAPIIEVMVAARLLAGCGDNAAVWLQQVAQGKIVVPSLTPADRGFARIVPGGSVADAIVVLDGENLVLVSGKHRAEPQANFGQLPVARWNLGAAPHDESVLLATGETARAAMDAAIAEWKLLSAAFLTGLSRQALDVAAAYAKERVQFGRPIGTFQGLAHPLADAVTDIEGGRLLLWKAIWSLAEARTDASAMTSLAWWWNGRAGVKALRQAIRTAGGYGLSLEYDLQLYHRRGTSLVLLGGDPQHELQQAGDLLFLGKSATLPDPGVIGIDFGPGERAQRYANDLRSFFRANWDERMRTKAHHSTASHDAAFHRKLAGAGLVFGNWPEEHGGTGHGAGEDLAASLAFEEWNYTSHVLATTNMVAQIVMRFGSAQAKAEILPRIKAGEAVCSLGFSEPGSGSDVFATRTAAVREGDEWIVNGQKMFTTGGHFADYVLLLARTDGSGSKHEGLTFFVVPTKLAGYDYQPIATYQDERTNITFYSDMRIPDRYRVGEEGQGAAVMGAALTLEHGGGNYFSGQTRMMRNALAWASSPDSNGLRPLDDPSIRARLAAVRARFEVADCFVVRSVWASAAGQSRRYQGPMAKVFITEGFLQSCWDILEMGGPDSILTGDHPLGVVELDHRRAYATTIYGGTSEIHRSMVAEQALGLPKSRS